MKTFQITMAVIALGFVVAGIAFVLPSGLFGFAYQLLGDNPAFLSLVTLPVAGVLALLLPLFAQSMVFLSAFFGKRSPFVLVLYALTSAINLGNTGITIFGQTAPAWGLIRVLSFCLAMGIVASVVIIYRRTELEQAKAA